jgi:hypothetical protein
MNPNSNPIDYLIDIASESGVNSFIINNAKDELKRLRQQLEKLNESLANPVAYARVNDTGDLYDLRLQNNPYNDQTTVVPLYRI